METPQGMETSGFWEEREDESHLAEKYHQAVSRNSSSLHQALPIALLRIRVGPRIGIQFSPYEIVYG